MDELGIIFEIALRGAKEGAFWVTIGTLGAGALSIAALAFGYRHLSKRDWPAKENWGVWSRRILGLFWLITLPPAIAFAGAMWGAGVAVKKWMESDEFVLQALVPSLNHITAGVCAGIEAMERGEKVDRLMDDTEAFERRAEPFIAGEKTLRIETIEKQIAHVEDALLRETLKMASDEAADDSAWGKIRAYVTAKAHEWILKKRIDEIHTHIDPVFVKLRTLDGGEDGEVTAAEISEAVSRVHIVPHVEHFVESFIKIELLMTVAPVFLICAAPAALFEFYRRKKLGKKDLPKTDLVEDAAELLDD